MQATVLLFILLHFSFCTSNPRCPKGEVYDKCGSACPLTCDTPADQFCTDQCVSGCFCSCGRVRNHNGTCVSRNRCRRCPKGETWNECGSACPATCSRPFPKVCTLQCVTGCVCNEGTIRDTTTNKCVSPADCKCPTNERYTACGSECDATCSQPKPACTKQCVNRCSCVEGYIRDENNNYKCIPIENCPIKGK